MFRVQQSGLLVLASLLLAACSSTNSLSTSSSIDPARETGVLMFSTRNTEPEGQNNGITMNITAMRYDAASRCVTDAPGPLDEFSIGGLALDDGVRLFRPRTVWHMFELLPGDYVITDFYRQVSFYPASTRTYNLTGQAPLLRVTAGEVTYMGDYALTPNVYSYFSHLGHSVDEAEAELARYPNLGLEMRIGTPRTVPLDCVPGEGERARDMSK